MKSFTLKLLAFLLILSSLSIAPAAAAPALPERLTPVAEQAPNVVVSVDSYARVSVSISMSGSHGYRASAVMFGNVTDSISGTFNGYQSKRVFNYGCWGPTKGNLLAVSVAVDGKTQFYKYYTVYRSCS